MKKKKLIIIWDVIFREFDYHRLELEKLSKFIDIEIHEMNQIFNPLYAKVYQDKSNRKIIKRYKSYKKWKNDFEKLIKIQNIWILIQNNGNNFIKFYLNLFLTRKNIKVIYISNNTVREAIHPTEFNLASIINKLKNKPSIKLIYYFFSSRFFSLLNKLFIKPNFIIANSLYDYNYRKKNKNKITKILKGNSFDYSNYITYRSNKFNYKFKKNFSVFIDSSGPRGIDEHAFQSNIKTHSPEKWFPSANRFFDFLEKNFQTRIKICPHPKRRTSKYSKDFHGRENIQNNLLHMVKNSKIVVSKGSTGLIYAVVFRKPILLIYSNEMLRHKSYMRNNVNSFSKDLNLSPINIDENYNKDFIEKRLTINEKARKNYLKTYATARTDSKPNYKILIEILKGKYN